MFKNLPLIRPGNLESFVDSKDFETVVEELNSYVQQLRDENNYLAKVVENSAQVAVLLDFLEDTPKLQGLLLGNVITAILLVLQVIDREIGNAKLEEAYGPIRPTKIK